MFAIRRPGCGACREHGLQVNQLINEINCNGHRISAVQIIKHINVDNTSLLSNL